MTQCLVERHIGIGQLDVFANDANGDAAVLALAGRHHPAPLVQIRRRQGEPEALGDDLI